MVNKYIGIFNDNQDENGEGVDKVDIGNLSANELNRVNFALRSNDVLSPTEKGVVVNKLDYLVLFLEHLREYKQNKADYKRVTQNVQPHQCVLSADYKQKIPIGHKVKHQINTHTMLDLDRNGFQSPRTSDIVW